MTEMGGPAEFLYDRRGQCALSAPLPRLLLLSLSIAALVLGASAALPRMTAAEAGSQPVAGYAWSSNIGWISFDGTLYGVYEDTANGALSYAVFTEPSTAPPGGNVEPPINTSSTAQTKQGELNVMGNIGIGTNSPTEKLDVAGNVKGTGLCIGSDCRTSWPAGG